MDIPFLTRREPARHDHKIILHCQACEFRALVDVKPIGVTDWVCPSCLTANRVTSEKHSRDDWIKELARKARMRK
jgi:hypothetical protein